MNTLGSGPLPGQDDAAVRSVVETATCLIEGLAGLRGAARVVADGIDARSGDRPESGLAEIVDRCMVRGEVITAATADPGSGPSVCAVPIHGSGGRVIGAIAAEYPAGARGRGVIDGLHGVAGLIAGQMAALSNGRLLSEASAAANESERIVALARALIGSITVNEVVRNAVDHLGRIGIGNVVSVGVVDAGHEVIRLRHGGRAAADLASRWPRIAIDAPLPMAEAVRTGDLVEVKGTDDERFPGLGAELDRLDADVYLATPMRGTAGDLVGALGIAAGDDQAVDVALLHRLASIIGDAVERTTLLERTTTTARILSTAIRPTRIDPVPGIELGAAFSLADDDAMVGGDWYDVLPGRSTIGLVVGDVAGHDVAAARTAARLRFALAALFDERPDDPMWVMERLHRHAKGVRSRRAATILLAAVDPASGAVRVVSAGHPPPAVQRGEEATLLDVSPMPPIGTIDGAGRTAELTLGIGDRLVLFSDGIVECRDETIDRGFDRLLRVVEQHRGSVSSLARMLADGTSGHDDASTLILERVRYDS